MHFVSSRVISAQGDGMPMSKDSGGCTREQLTRHPPLSLQKADQFHFHSCQSPLVLLYCLDLGRWGFVNYWSTLAHLKGGRRQTYSEFSEVLV